MDGATLEDRKTIPRRARWVARWLRPFQIDIRALAAMRIVLGIVILYDLCQFARLLKVYYTDWGVSPRGLLLPGISGMLSFYSLSGSYAWAIAVLGAHAILALLFTLGYQTRAMTVGLALMGYSLITRNPTLTHGGKSLELWLLIWSVFLPLGAAESVDALRAGFDWRRARLRRVANVASAAILIQIALVYWSAVSGKVDPKWTSNFTAIYYLLHSSWATPLGHWIGGMLPLIQPLTFMTVALEIVGAPLALLAWDMPRTRIAVVLAFISFHLGLVFTMYVGTFGFICIAGWLPFLPAEFWNWIARSSLARGVCTAWDRLIQLAASILRFPPRPTIPAVHLKPAVQIVLSIALAYLVMVNLLLDFQSRFHRFSGPLSRLPSFKQSWAVMSTPSQYFGTLVIELHLVNGTVHEVSCDDAPDGSFYLTLARASTEDEYWRPALITGELEHLVQYRVTLILDSLLKPSPILARFCEFHRRLWDQSHDDPMQKVVALDAYCQYDAIPPFDFDPMFHPTSGRWKLHAWPVEVKEAGGRRM